MTAIKFRKKPDDIEGMMVSETNWVAISKWLGPTYTVVLITQEPGKFAAIKISADYFKEHSVFAEAGKWITKDSEGYLCVYDNRILEQMYDVVSA